MNKRLYQILALVWLSIVIILGAYDVKKMMSGDNIQFDLLALLPQSETEKMRQSNELMEDGNISGRIVIAFGHELVSNSKEAFLSFRNQVASSGLPLLENDTQKIESDYKTLFTDLYSYRASLISKDDRKLLLEGRNEIITRRAISNIHSPFGMFNAAQMTSDPFGFFPRFATSLRADGAVQIDEDGIIVVNSGGKIWHIYQGVITEKIYSLKLQEKISETLLPLLTEIEEKSSVEVLKVGAAFYASAGAQLAQSEISKISFISTIGIILLLLLVFHRPNPIFLALAVVISGLICGLAACLYFFGSIHILSLVFGCSLVGVSVDYALHYYCASFKPVDRFKILLYLIPAMPLGVLTSSIGYGSLVIAPFPGIQQMAILACMGLLCTFISVSLWGPFFIKSSGRKIPLQALKTQQFLENFASKVSFPSFKKLFLIFIIPLFCLGTSRLTFDDNVRNFQAKDPILQDQEEQIKALLNFENSTKFLAVSHPDMEIVLQTEEQITQLLDQQGIGYRSLSDLIPSQKRQQENFQLKLQFCTDNFKEVGEIFDLDSFDELAGGFDALPLIADANFIKKLPIGWKELVHVDDKSMITGRVMLNSPVDSDVIIESSGINYIDPVHEYTSLFSAYRQVMMILVASLFLGFAFVISIRQGLRAAISISTPVLTSILMTVGLFGMFGIGFSMFHAMGLILVLCIGIDYALFLYWRKNAEKELLLLGNAMAAVTTILSFGVLTLSTTAAVHSFGLTVLIGIILNFLITTLFMETTKCKKS